MRKFSLAFEVLSEREGENCGDLIQSPAHLWLGQADITKGTLGVPMLISMRAFPEEFEGTLAIFNLL
jgi:hypothetical protein